jgi:hypothetical protein
MLIFILSLFEFLGKVKMGGNLDGKKAGWAFSPARQICSKN